MRMQVISGRIFYDYDGVTVKDPIKTLTDSGLNAVRVETSRDVGLGLTVFQNNASTRAEELLFQTRVTKTLSQLQDYAEAYSKILTVHGLASTSC